MYLWIRRWKEEGSLNSHKACGRPRKTTAFEDQQILQAYCQNLKVTDVAKASKISTASLRRRLREAGLIANKIPRKKVRVRACSSDVLPAFADLQRDNLIQRSDLELQSDTGLQPGVGLQSDIGRMTPDIPAISDIGRLA